jgi:tripartite-type tricarboxylate transporter receptor subunit TctC
VPKRDVSDPMVAFTAAAIQKRLQSPKSQQYHDFLSRFLNADSGEETQEAHLRYSHSPAKSPSSPCMTV